MAEIKDEEQKLASWTLQKFKDAMNAKENITANWLEYMNAWNNALYENQSAPSYKSNHVSNLIYSTIESMRPILFDGDPKFEAIPLTKEALEYSHDINTILDYEWKRTGMTSKCIANSIYTLCIGTSIFMLPYTFKDNGSFDGDVEPIPINPFNLYPDPLATCVEDAEYIIYATYRHQNQLKQMYPEKAELIDGGDVKYNELVNSRNENAKINNQVLVLEVWCRDYTTIEVEEEDGSTSTKQQFPLGRVIITAPELDIVFEDKENPYETGRFPFFLFKDIDVPFQFWGEGEIKWLLSPQKAINDLSNQIIDNAKHTANMQWIVDKTAGIPKGSLTNRPGLIIRKNPGSEVRRDSPPSMPMYVSEMISRLENNIEVVSGIHDVTRGQNPGGGIESGAAIVALQEAAQTRMRLKITLHQEQLGVLGTEWLSRLKQFWKVNRLIPQEKAVSETLPTQELNGIEIQSNNMFEPKYDWVEVTQADQLAQDYRIVVQGAVSMKLNRASMLDTMIRLAQTQAEDGMPMVTRECVLDYLPNVNKEVILQYFNKIKQEQIMIQQQEMMNNEAMQQLQSLGQGLGEVNGSVQSLQQRASSEDEAKKRDEIMSQGYQQGVNEAQAMQTAASKSGGIPEELLTQMASMNDEELAQVLQQYPELADMI